MNGTTDMRHLVMTSTPVGPLVLVADGHALAGVYMHEHRHAPDASAFGSERPDDPFLTAVRQQLVEYFAGERTDFDIPIQAAGTEFQQRVWAALRTIPFGKTWSYRELAESIGQPSASRAVGLANGRNPVSIVVPCHRVVGANGSLTGYGGGLDNKRVLLDLERGAEEAGALF